MRLGGLDLVRFVGRRCFYFFLINWDLSPGQDLDRSGCVHGTHALLLRFSGRAGQLFRRLHGAGGCQRLVVLCQLGHFVHCLPTGGEQKNRNLKQQQPPLESDEGCREVPIRIRMIYLKLFDYICICRCALFEYFHRIPLRLLSSSLKDALLNGFHFEFSDGGRLG